MIVNKLARQLIRSPEIVWYVLLALIIMGPLILSGYALTLDMVFTPKLLMPHGLTHDYPYRFMLYLLNIFMSGAIVEKIVIFSTLLISAVGMHRLVRTEEQWARYFAGIFYTINPFTYERWMAGQYLIIAGYALLPWVARALFDFLKEPGRRTALRLSLWYTAVAIVSVHMFVLAALLGIISFAIYALAQSPKGHYYRRLWLWGGGVLLATLFLNNYWLIGLVRGTSPISATVDAIGSSDLHAFTTASNPHDGLVFNVLSMFGFWAERAHRFAMPNSSMIVWIGGFALIALLVLVGIRRQLKLHALPAACIGLAMIIGFIVALGVDAPIVGGLNHWSITHLPLMKGFREPQKFSALLVLGYVYFAASGLETLLAKLPKKAEGRREILRDAYLLLPVFYVSTMPLGFAKQLKPVQYPAAWYSFEQRLEKEPGSKVLFLPWHQYMSYDFEPRVIANPAPDFFHAGTIVSSRDAELDNIKAGDVPSDNVYLQKHVLPKISPTAFGHQLSSRHIKYVVLSGGYDYQKYTWLANEKDLKLVSKQPGLTVYRNEAYHG